MTDATNSCPASSSQCGSAASAPAASARPVATSAARRGFCDRAIAVDGSRLASPSMNSPSPSSDRRKPQRTADPRHDTAAVTTGEHALQIGAVDLDANEARARRDVLHRGRKDLDLGHRREALGIRYAACPRDTDEISIGSRMARLPAGLAIDLVVEHDDGEVTGLLQ